jgi:maleylpyruvate isomerase
VTRPDRDIAGAQAAHRGLLEMLAAVEVVPAAPSRLPGWTVGHVLTHVARNADSMARVLEASERGEVVDRYPDGEAGRDADIEAGHDRTADVLVADVGDSAARLEAAWAAHTAWGGLSRETSGREVPVRDQVAGRRREVEVHRVDLGLGYEPEDWPAEYIRLDLRALEMRWNARRPMGLTGLPPEALALPPPRRLAWLLGRIEIPGLAPANVL